MENLNFQSPFKLNVLSDAGKTQGGGAQLEYDDVYQQLALRLIRAVAGFDPQKGTLQQHIFAQLKYELLNCKSAYRLCGLTGAPKEYRKSDMVSLDHISEGSSLYEQVMAA